MTIYVVKRGDTLDAISRKYGVTIADLVWANQLSAPNVLSVGQALAIPTEQTVYTVRRGDSVYSIARSYGMDTAAVLAANPLIGSGRIFPGQRIVLPFPNENLGRAVLHGYITDSSETSLRSTLPYLSFLAPFSYRTDLYGGLTPTFSVRTDLSPEYRTANLLTVTNLKEEGGFSSAILHALFTDSEVQDAFLENLLALLDDGSWYGVNLDFEYVFPYDRGSYNQFLRRLTELLHTRGCLVVTALAPKLTAGQQGLLYAGHDYAFHGETADYVNLMTYEWGYTYGPAMAVSPINMVRRVLDYAVTAIPAGKILLGMPNYGYNWTLPFLQGTAAQPVTNAGATALAGAVGAEIQFDETAQAPFFRYTDPQGRRHEVWFEDPRSLRAKYRLVNAYGLAGVSFWNLNRFYRPNFLLFESMYQAEKVLS